jgi:hypothetical protein
MDKLLKLLMNLNVLVPLTNSFTRSEHQLFRPPCTTTTSKHQLSQQLNHTIPGTQQQLPPLYRRISLLYVRNNSQKPRPILSNTTRYTTTTTLLIFHPIYSTNYLNPSPTLLVTRYLKLKILFYNTHEYSPIYRKRGPDGKPPFFTHKIHFSGCFQVSRP